MADSEIGWGDCSPDASEIVELRNHLEANGGLRGLDIVEPGDIERAVRVFRRDGFVVVADVLDDARLDTLRQGCDEVSREIVAIDPELAGNRGSHRYSYGASSRTRGMLHRPEWLMLLELPAVAEIVGAIFESDDYVLRSAGGDFCLPGAVGYQPLHSDMRDWIDDETTPFSAFRDPRGHLSTRDLPCPYVCVNFLTTDATAINGPTRQIPGSQHSRELFPTLLDEPEWMRLSTVCPAPAGAVQIRDVRAWHGGTPNLSKEIRSIPNVEYYAPWFREPTVPCIPYDDYQALSAQAKRAARFAVADSGATLDLGYEIGPTPRRMASPSTAGRG